MKHLFRFHGRRSEEGSWELMDEEWHHILKVLRLASGAAIEIADGQGWVAQATLDEVGKHKGSLQLSSETFQAKPLSQNELVMGLGILKPQGIDEVLPGLVELGVNRLLLIPFLGMDRSRVSEKLLDRWQRQIISASKQAKAAWFPELQVLKSFDAFMEEAVLYPTRYLLDPDGTAEPLSAQLVGPVLAVIGSEGGWHETEVEKFSAHGFQKLRLKSNILRATTAVIATAGIFRQGMSES
ncbi:MAG: 16S rRNA (uracil(1498)-N(3))-methyltransferase [Proteobacteria bacterium]|nr:MAG: 16S rRNA (uracil(1498)-N(3))-methyltransferase [Pseudomonadota bacterium]